MSPGRREPRTNRTRRAPRPFWRNALYGGLLLSAALNAPVLSGRVPLPAGLVIGFPAFSSTRIIPPPPAHAELGDSVTQFYLWRRFAREAVFEHGELPLWNPRLLGGIPFLANATSALAYPFHLVGLFLPTPLAWSLKILCLPALAFFFTALAARELGASPAGSLAGGAIFALCGFLVGWQVWPQGDAALWLPLAVFAIHRLRTRGSPASVALAAAALALPVLAGHPEVAIYVGLTGVAFWLWLLLGAGPSGRAPSRRRFALLFACVVVLAGCLAAIQILPTAEWVAQLVRSPAQSWHQPRPVTELAAALVSRHAKAAINPVGVAIPEGAAYAGMLSLALAPAALAGRRRGFAIFAVLLLVAAAQVAYGFGAFEWVAVNAPLLRGLRHNRAIVLLDFALALLAALGFTALTENREDPRRRRALWLGTAGLLVSGAAVATVSYQHRGADVLGGLWGIRSSWAFWAAGGGLILAAAWAAPPAKLWRRVALAVLVLDLGTFAFRHVPFVDRSWLYPESEVYRFLRTRPGAPHRIATLGDASPVNASMAFGLDAADGYDFLLRDNQRMLGPLASHQLTHTLRFRETSVAAGDDHLLDLLNVRYFITTRFNTSTAVLEARPERFRLVYDDRAVQVFENSRALPRAFLVPLRRVRAVATADEMLAVVSDRGFDPATMAVVAHPLRTPAPSAPPAGRSQVVAVEAGISRHRIRVQAAEPSLLVYSEFDYPGWGVRVNGRPAPLLRVDYALKGVQISPGEHDVIFSFRPASAMIGGTLSFGAALATGALVVASRRGPQRSGPMSPVGPALRSLHKGGRRPR
jgi:hypothetical protein